MIIKTGDDVILIKSARLSPMDEIPFDMSRCLPCPGIVRQCMHLVRGEVSAGVRGSASALVPLRYIPTYLGTYLPCTQPTRPPICLVCLQPESVHPFLHLFLHHAGIRKDHVPGFFCNRLIDFDSGFFFRSRDSDRLPPLCMSPGAQTRQIWKAVGR